MSFWGVCWNDWVCYCSWEASDCVFQKVTNTIAASKEASDTVRQSDEHSEVYWGRTLWGVTVVRTAVYEGNWPNQIVELKGENIQNKYRSGHEYLKWFEFPRHKHEWSHETKDTACCILKILCSTNFQIHVTPLPDARFIVHFPLCQAPIPESEIPIGLISQRSHSHCFVHAHSHTHARANTHSHSFQSV